MRVSEWVRVSQPRLFWNVMYMRKKSPRGFAGSLFGLLVVVLLTIPALPAWAASQAPAPTPVLQVVASFSILADMVREVGGDYVSVTTLVGAGTDSHSFEPSPRDSAAMAQAKVLFVNGLGFETWLPRLISASGFKGTQVIASKGITPRMLGSGQEAHAKGKKHNGHSHGSMVDPHAWQSLVNGMLYARNIAEGLAQADPPRAEIYRARADDYIKQMKKLDNEVRHALASIPAQRRRVVTTHDAFGYFGHDYGIEFISIVGLSNDAEPSARDLANIVDLVKRQHASALFLENAGNSRLIEQVARETEVNVGGTLFSDSLGQPDEPAGTYLGLIKWNAGQLIYALKP